MRKAVVAKLALTVLVTAPAAHAQELVRPEEPAAPRAPAEPAKADAVAVSEPKSPEDEGRLRPYAIGELGLPRAFGIAAGARIGRRFAAELEVAGLPRGVASFGDDTRTSKSASISFFAASANGAWFPLRAFPLTLGLGVGYQSATSETRTFGSDVAYTASSLTVTPRVGFEYLIKDRIPFGVVIGIPALLARDTKLDSDGQTSGNARKVANTFGAPVEERFALFGFPFLQVRAGYAF